jgi:hypothetical protein
MATAERNGNGSTDDVHSVVVQNGDLNHQRSFRTLPPEGVHDSATQI